MSNTEPRQTGCSFFVNSSVSYTEFLNEDENQKPKAPKIPPRPSLEKLRQLKIPNTNNIMRRRQSHPLR